MQTRTLRTAIHRSVLAALASAATAGAGCACPESIVVSPLGDGGLPDGISGFNSDRSLTSAECSQLCQNRATRCQIVHTCTTPTCPTGTGALGVACNEVLFCPVSGRRPEGFVAGIEPSREIARTAAFFAYVTQLESASIAAFDRLASELQTHGAPPSLVSAARQSARDEIRHARLAATIATEHGIPTEPPTFEPEIATRSLFDVALENAVEGCVRETYGAAAAGFQAARAGDPTIREISAQIARDEARHAALSWKIAAWTDAKLGPAERSAIALALRAAVDTLRCELRIEPDASVRDLAGIPSAADARRLMDSLDASLWSRAA